MNLVILESDRSHARDGYKSRGTREQRAGESSEGSRVSVEAIMSFDALL